MNRGIGFAAIIAGILLICAALAAGLFSLGKSFQAISVLSGFLLISWGWGWQKAGSPTAIITGAWAGLKNAPPLAWVLAGFGIVFWVYFIQNMFLNDAQRLAYFTRYLPTLEPIGNDLNYNIKAITLWVRGENPYSIGYHFYPPLYHIVFTPLNLLTPERRFAVITLLTLAAYIAIFSLRWPGQKRNSGVLLFFCLTGLVSYGMQLELERGQFNVLALFLALAGVWMYHNWPAFRILAGVLWVIATHIKLYPGAFGLLFFSQWKDWRENLGRLTQLGLLNLLAFFALGWNVFVQFLDALLEGSNTTTWLTPDKQPINHSIRAFLYKLAQNNDHEVPQEFASWLQASSSWLLWVFFVIILGCAAIIIWKTLQKENTLLHPNILLVCILLGLLLPGVSIDYKLVLLAPGLGMAVSNLRAPAGWQKIPFAGLLLMIGWAYSLSLIPYLYRSGIFITAFPMVFMILIGLTGLSLLNYPHQEAL